jgi:hypothetical protein
MTTVLFMPLYWQISLALTIIFSNKVLRFVPNINVSLLRSNDSEMKKGKQE